MWVMCAFVGGWGEGGEGDWGKSKPASPSLNRRCLRRLGHGKDLEACDPARDPPTEILRKLPREWGCARKPLVEWIDEASSPFHREVQMRTGAEPGAAAVRDHLLLLHARAPVQSRSKGRKVQVTGLQPVRVSDANHPARAVFRSDSYHRTVGDRPDRGTD